MRISVFGPRKITKEDTLKIQESMDKIIGELTLECITLLLGGASGTQKIVEEYFKDMYDIVVFQPWTMIKKDLIKEKYDPTYFFYRNIQIVDNSDVVCIYDNGNKDAEVYKVKNYCKNSNIQFWELDKV